MFLLINLFIILTFPLQTILPFTKNFPNISTIFYTWFLVILVSCYCQFLWWKERNYFLELLGKYLHIVFKLKFSYYSKSNQLSKWQIFGCWTFWELKTMCKGQRWSSLIWGSGGAVDSCFLARPALSPAEGIFYDFQFFLRTKTFLSWKMSDVWPLFWPMLLYYMERLGWKKWFLDW